MNTVKLIEIGEEIHEDNRLRAEEVKSLLGETHTRMINIMASPGAGKTSLILKTAEALKDALRICVIEADIDSLTDAEKVAAAGVEAVQLHTGGFCHVDAYMMRKTIGAVDLENTDLLILENVGNLICPAQSDTGTELNVVISSVPEGDDKPLKYPLIFRVCDVLIINKIDFLPLCEFNLEAFRARAHLLNPEIVIFELSCRTGEGVAAWTDWLREWTLNQP
jgi:hydrogenase nickel incorporation protein HypB